MNYKHKNSGEIYDLSQPQYDKSEGRYGWIVLINGTIYFIALSDAYNEPEDITFQFEKL